MKDLTQGRKGAKAQRQVRVSICAQTFQYELCKPGLGGTYTRPHLLGAFAPLRLCVRPSTGNYE